MSGEDVLRVNIDMETKAKLESNMEAVDEHALPVSEEEFTSEKEKKNTWWDNNKGKVWLGTKVALWAGFAAYFIAACALDFQRAIPLVGITAFVAFCVLCAYFNEYAAEKVYAVTVYPFARFCKAQWRILKWVCTLVAAGIIIAFIAVDMWGDWMRFVSIGGLFFFIAMGYLCSWKRHAINWRPIIWGISLQLVFGFLVLKWQPGYNALDWLSGHVSRFLSYSDEGAAFVFGEGFREHFFAFKVLPTVIFFASFMGICYYFGLMQMIIAKLSFVMQKTLGTSAAESLNAAGNIFLGQTEAPLLIKPFLKGMTKSELHAVMTGGFGTIAGSVMAAFIGFGISASSLMAASVMAAPACLAMSKLVYPEEEESETAAGTDFVLPKSEAQNVIEAASAGASDAIPLALNIGAAMIAFVSLLGLVNNMFVFVGDMVGVEGFTFEFACSYVLRPIAFLMGVPWVNADEVASLMGLKMFINEFVAYTRLADMIKAGILSKRAETIATFALCGFANFSSIAVQLGGLGAMAPNRYRDLATLALSAMLTGTATTWMNACIAGILLSAS